MVAALHDLGLRDAFDVVYGSSAGAINGAYFLSGQPEGSQIYVQDLPNNTKFIDVKRLFFGQPAMSLEYLVNEFLQSRENPRALKWEALVDCPIPLKAVASSLTRQQPVTIHANTSRVGAAPSMEELFGALRATAQVPILAGQPFEWKEDQWVDGALFEPIPFHSAVDDNCTHVLALLTRPPKAELRDGAADPFKLWWAKRFIPRYLERLYERGHIYTDDHYERDIELIKRHTADPKGAIREPLPDHALHLETRVSFGSQRVPARPAAGLADEVTTVSAGAPAAEEPPHPPPAPRRCCHLRGGADLSEESCGKRAYMYGVLPPNRLGTVSNMEMDSRRLLEGVAAGYEAITSVFSKALSAGAHHQRNHPHRRGHGHGHAHGHGHGHPHHAAVPVAARAGKRGERPSRQEAQMMKKFAKSGLADIIK
eukprot:tig00000339_g24179.t1